jgi:uncharacterized protein (DUF2147 family)
MKRLSVLLVLFFIVFRLYASPAPDDIVGVWANSSNKAHIEIFKSGGRYYGKIIWLKNPNDATGKPKIDKRNPDENARNKRILGLVVLRDFKYDDEEWNNGRIYNPEDGKEYKSYIKLTDARTLSVRGYIGISFIGKTEKFTRIR